MNHPHLPEDDPLISTAAFARLTGLHPETILLRARQKKPGFPAPVKLAKRNYRWRRSEVLRWLSTLQEGASHAEQASA